MVYKAFQGVTHNGQEKLEDNYFYKSPFCSLVPLYELERVLILCFSGASVFEMQLMSLSSVTIAKSAKVLMNFLKIFSLICLC